jgi:nucleoside-diphosphate-sugar epimerase
MKILVTGANGYIGSKVVSKLLDDGNEVVAVDLKNDKIDKRAAFLSDNIFSEKKDWFSFLGRPDVCLHLAWRNGFVHDSETHLIDLPNHYKFISNLISNGLTHVSVMGTMHEIGYFEGAIKDTTPCNPLSLYGISKNALRQSLGILCAQKKVNFKWLRAFYIYGDDFNANSIFSKLRKSASEGNKTFPLNSGKNEYDFISVSELANQISKAITQDRINGIINICSGKHISLGKFIEEYIKLNKLDIKINYGAFPERQYDSPCIYGDNSKISEIMRRTK